MATVASTDFAVLFFNTKLERALLVHAGPLLSLLHYSLERLLKTGQEYVVPLLLFLPCSTKFSLNFLVVDWLIWSRGPVWAFFGSIGAPAGASLSPQTPRTNYLCTIRDWEQRGKATNRPAFLHNNTTFHQIACRYVAAVAC